MYICISKKKAFKQKKKEHFCHTYSLQWDAKLVVLQEIKFSENSLSQIGTKIYIFMDPNSTVKYNCTKKFILIPSMPPRDLIDSPGYHAVNSTVGCEIRC